MARRGSKHPNALAAAATNIDLAQPKVAARQAARAQAWQSEAWAYFDEVPEIKESVRYRGNQLGKVRLFCAVENPDDPNGAPIPVESDGSGVPPEVAEAAVAELSRLRSQVGGQAEVMRELDMNLEVAGECYLVGFGAYAEEVTQRDGSVQRLEHPEDWQIKSVAEVEMKGSGSATRFVVKDRPSDPKGRPLDPDQDTIIRIWTRHPQWSSLPDSPMRALLQECATLQALSQQVQAEANSRQSAGMFTVPNELSFGGPDPTDPTDGLNDEDADPFLDELQTALTQPIADPTSASSVMPMLLRGPAEYLRPEFVRQIDFGRGGNADQLERQIDARVARIARGLNLPIEKIMGHQETTYANAAQVDEDEYNDYLRPSADTATEALTYAFLTPQLRENPAVPAEWTTGVVFVAVDPSPLISSPDTEANADEAFEKGTISAQAYNRAKGFNDGDEPDPLELLQRAGLRRGILTADVTKALLDLLGVDVDWPVAPMEELPPVPPDGGDEAVQAAARAIWDLAVANDYQPPLALPAAATPAPAEPPDLGLGRRLTDIDRDLRTRLVVASNEAMNRALDRAANRLRSKAGGTDVAAVVRSSAKREVFALLGPSLVAQVLGDDDPLAGAFDDLEDEFMRWGAQAQTQAVDVAGQVASGFSTVQRSALKLRQAGDLGEAWGWMKESLMSLARGLLYDPSPAAPDLGEFDPNLKVPTGLVRQAIARAGGATGLTTNGTDIHLALVDAGTRPAGGIGTGEAIRDVLRENGTVEDGYVWEYGPAFRSQTFHPHLALDGVRFQTFDDPVLANPNPWPPGGFYIPGDHKGCICDFSPIIMPPTAGQGRVGPSEATPARYTLEQLSDQSEELRRLAQADPSGSTGLFANMTDRVNSGTRDPGLKVLRDAQGFNGLPTVVDDDVFDGLIQGGYTPVYRGTKGSGTGRAFQSGDHYPGVGMYGNGTYTSASKDLARMYAGSSGDLASIGIKPDARVITWEDLRTLMAEAPKRPNVTRFADEASWIEASYRHDLLYGDPGRYATSLGYDVIYSPGASGAPEYVILNRTAVVTRRTIEKVGQ